MARRAKEPDLGAEQKEHQITEALERKRRQLDQEIADFKAGKEHEYREFERQLRDKSRENGQQDALQIQRKRGRSRQKTAAAEASSTQKEDANRVQRETNIGETSQTGPSLDVEDQIATVPSNRSPASFMGLPDRPIGALHEQEKDFRGLFTPSYLALVGGKHAGEGGRFKRLLQPPSLDSGDVSAARQNTSALLSSSAEVVHPPMASPPLRPLSSSVPPEKPSHHRRDSSRSDASIASLRSSLRDPKQPRSPKRVLFSIDDTLVSPSTSPIAQRSKPATDTMLVTSVDAIGGFEKFEVVRNQNSDGPAANRPQSNGVGFSSLSAPANLWAASLSTFGRATELNRSKPSPSASGADDFEHLESDDLFTFDEHIGQTGRNKPQETDLEKEYDEDEEVEDKSEDPFTASSPHAGSLPIEIKWPGRREGRG